MKPLNNLLQVPQKLADENKYPPHWKEIATRIKKTAGWKCTACGHNDDPRAGYQLTVHHLNGIKSDCRNENLVALCQRCHLRAQGILRRKIKKILQEEKGQSILFTQEKTKTPKLTDIKAYLRTHQEDLYPKNLPGKP